MKGIFITIYGINNIGKSTHAKRLVDKLNSAGLDAVYLKYPIYDLEPTGPKLNSILRAEGQHVSEQDLQTLFMQNRRDYEPDLRKMINEGKIVVAEDYTYTGIAWGNAKGLSMDYMLKLNENLLKEDFTILLTGQRNLAAVEKRHIHEKNNHLIDNVGNILRQLADIHHWTVIQVQPRIDDTAELIFQAVSGFLARRAVKI
jgi:thymidylate kinase